VSEPVPLLGLSRPGRVERSGWERFLDRLFRRPPQVAQLVFPRPPLGVMASRTLGALREEGGGRDADRVSDSSRPGRRTPVER
jgi:hypothetical protein